MSRSRLPRPLALWFAFAVAQSAAHGAQTAEKAWTINLHATKGMALRVENVLGAVEVHPAQSASQARAQVQVIAEGKTAEEAGKLAASVTVASSGGEAARLQVVLPPDIVAARLPKSGKNPVARWLDSLIHRKEEVEVPMGDRTVRVVTDRKAPAVAVRLAVFVPYGSRVAIRQGAGSIRVDGVRGDYQVENRDGRVDVSSMFGTLAIDAAASDVGVMLFQGTALDVRTTEGEVALQEIRSRKLRIQTASGKVSGASLAADETSIATGTGDVKLTGLEPKTAELRSEAGTVDVAVRMAGMRRAAIDSAAGDVVLRVGQGLSFDLLATTKSGEVKALGMTLEALGKSGERLRFRRGLGGGPEFDVRAGRALTVRPYDASRFDILVGDVSR